MCLAVDLWCGVPPQLKTTDLWKSSKYEWKLYSINTMSTIYPKKVLLCTFVLFSWYKHSSNASQCTNILYNYDRIYFIFCISVLHIYIHDRSKLAHDLFVDKILQTDYECNHLYTFWPFVPFFVSQLSP